MARPYTPYMQKLKERLHLGNLDAEYVNHILEIVYLQGKADGQKEEEDPQTFQNEWEEVRQK